MHRTKNLCVFICLVILACGRPGHNIKNENKNSIPEANAGSDKTSRPGTSLAFDGSQSTDADGEIVSYSWNMGDGSEKDGVNIEHSYSATGTYTVVLTVTDDAGDSASDSLIVNVDEENPIARFSVSSTDLTAGDVVTFNASTSEAVSEIVSYSWNFNDSSAAASGVEVTHVFAFGGTFNVELEVADTNGRTGSTEQNVVVANDPNQNTGGDNIPLSDVLGTYSLSYSSSSQICSGGYSTSPDENSLSVSEATSGSCNSGLPVSASGGSGNSYTGCYDEGASKMTLELTENGVQPGGGCSANLTTTFTINFSSASACSGYVNHFYDAAIGCQCSKTFTFANCSWNSN